MNGYAELHDLPLKVRADMLESVDGLSYPSLITELHYALELVDIKDPNSCKWLASLLARRANDLDAIDRLRAHDRTE